MSDLHPFLDSFREEHAKIKSELKALLDAEEWRNFFDRARELVLAHELREERFLFPALASKAEVRTGGPFCILYYDMHTNCPPLLQAASVCGGTPRHPTPLNVPDHLRGFFEENSPVSIPLQDHMALEQILNESASAEPAQLPVLAAIYFSIMSLHFEKEDRCLLAMCAQMVSDQEWTSWSEKANKV